MSTTKRCISLLLALSMVLGLIPQLLLAASAEQLPPKVTAVATKIEPAESTGTTEDGFIYTVHDGYVEITGYNGTATELVIPDTIGGLPVTIIGNSAFFSQKNLTDVIIPDSVVTIGSSAFSYCDNLASVEIGGGVTCIGDYAFRHCISLSNMEIPNSVITIGSYTFYECFGLTRVTIPDSITTIGGSAFGGCKGLCTVEIGDGVTSIGNYAFAGCSSLISAEIGNNVTRIPYAAFEGCTSLSSVIIPDNITVIGWNAFSGCVSLNSVKIGNSVDDISDGAFEGCESLTSVVIPSSVARIRNSAFGNCTNLETIIFKGDAPSIFPWAFPGVTATAYYPSGNPTWTSDRLQNYDGNITWVPGNPYVKMLSSIQEFLDKDIIRIRPMESGTVWTLFAPLSGVTVCSSIGEISPTNGEFDIYCADASAQEMILSKDGYRDYILPTEVTRTMRGEKGKAYKLTAYMQKDTKDGKPYISTVFGRESDDDKTYTELRSNPLIVREDSGCDIIVTAVGFGDQAVTYYLAQDSKRKVSSTTGVFTNELLYTVFDDTSTVYAYAVGSDGRQTEPVAIIVNREEALDLEKELGLDSEFSLLGKDFFKITISDDIPVLGGMELDMSAFTFPIGYSIVGDEVKISLGIDWFSSTDSDQGYKWKTFKDLVIKYEEDNTEDIDAFFKDYDKNLGKNWKKSNKANKFNMNVLGFIEGKWIDGEFVIKEGQINLGGNIKFQYNAQGAIWVVPVYGSFEAGADFSVGGKVNRFLPDRDIPFEFTLLLNVAPTVKGGAGAGIKGAVSVGLYAEGKLPLMIAFQEEHFTLDLEGEIGVEGELFLFHGKKVLVDGDTNLIDWYYGTSDSPFAVPNVTDQLQTITTVVPRDYAEHTSDWMGDRNPALSIQSMGIKTTASRGVTFRELQNSIFSNSQPQLVTVGDQMLMVWVEDDASRDTYNRMQLVYSVYDPLGDQWSEPQPVWDDGHNDGYPVLAIDGSQAYVLWQKVNTKLTAENTTDIDTTIENSELCLARFNADTGAFGDAQMITDNGLYEYAHNVVLEKGEPVVYWAAAEENALNASGVNALYRWFNGTESVLAQDLSYVLSVDAYDGDVTYVADIDGDLSSTEDVTATTISDFRTEVFDNSEFGAAVTYAGYAPLDGESVLFLSDMRNIYYNHNGEVKSVLEESRAMEGNLNIVETNHGTTIIWTEAVDGWNEIYAVSYKDGKWSSPIMISENGKLLTRISATGYDGKLFGVCNTNAVTYDESIEGYVKGETNLVLFQANDFSDIALANYMNINENTLEAGVDTSFNVTVYNNGTNSVEEISFTVSDTLGTESVQTVAVEIPSGGSETVALTYPVPDNYTATTLTVTATIANVDVKESDNTLSREIGNPDLTVNETAVEILSDGYKITAVIENGSLVDAENVTLSVFVDEEATDLLQSETIGTIARENYAIAEILVKNEALVYSENGTAKVYMKLVSDEEEASSADNTLCVVVSEAAETVCMHPVTEQIAGLEPTCTEAGYEAYEVCVACGEALGEATEIPARGHSHTALVTPPTCTEQGFTTYTCHCGDTYNSDYHAALGHDWDNGVVTVEPTEESKGEKLYTCKRCAETKVEILPELTHEHRYEAVVTAPTCTERGYTTHTCRCGDSYVDTYVNALGHDMSQWTVENAPTCTKDGTERRDCSRCEHYETRIVVTPGHDYAAHVTAPTCTEGGYTEYVCSVCGDSYISNHVPATGHDYKAVVTAPTCTEQGYTIYTCHCGDSYMTDYTNPLGHSFTNYISDNNATCTQDGTKTAVCDCCDATDINVDVGSALGHDFSEWTVVEEPTQTSDGLESRICYHCGLKETRVIPQLENPFTDVPEGSFYHAPVLWAVANGITNGTTAATFGPEDQCMRAHVVTFLWRAAGSPEPVSNNNPFVDVKETDFFYKAVLWALEKGITSGMDAIHFGPTSYCNRAQVVTFLYRTMGNPAVTSEENPFTDVASGSFYEKPVLWAVENGITNGMSATDFGPNSICNRAQIVTFLYRAFK